MARLGKLDGYDIKMGLRFPDDVAAWIVVEARKRRVSESVIVTEALRRHISGTSEPAQPSGPRPPGRPQKGKYSAKVLPPPSLEEELEAKGYPWTWDRLQEAFALTQTKPKNLAAHLGLTNISPWSGSGVPEKWWPLIRKFFEARGWTAPEQQQSIFSQD